MNRLYIIGNGFDRWHNLPTSYQQFYEFAKDILDEFGNYYLFDLSQPDPWYDFENALGAFSSDEFFDYFNEIDVEAEDFRPSFIYGLEDEITEQANQHVNDIKECFHNWVEQINILDADKKMAFPEDSRFINFNYTSTLESIYGIHDDKVLYIHGRADRNDDLIFGHGEPVSNQSEFDEYGESTRSMFSDAESAAQYPLFALKKPVDDVLEVNQAYFESLADISEITVIGHSLNKIDLPYFKRIAESSPTAYWNVCCYTEEEKTHHLEELIGCGVDHEKINICTYKQLIVQ